MLIRKQISTLILMVSTAGFAVAQTEDVDMFAQEGDAIIVASSADESGISGTTIMSMDASEFGGSGMIFDSMLGGGSMGFDVAGSDFSLLNDVSVQKDLNLVDGQLERIEAINKEFEEKMREKMDELRDDNGNFNFSGATGFGDLIADLKNRQQDEINSILLPNQQDRLKQVARQMKMKRLGSERALTKVLAEELGLSAEQARKIKEKSKQLQEDLNKKIAKLRADAKNELFAELSKEQRGKLEELLGEEFVVKDEDEKGKFRRMIRRSQSQARDF